MKNEANSEAREVAMFGCTVATLDRHTREALDRGPRALFVMSILSDAQEEIERGRGERARQLINRAKYLIDSER